MILVMNKKYSCESLVDIEQDIADALGSAPLPQDEHGMDDGTYVVRIEWLNVDEEND